MARNQIHQWRIPMLIYFYRDKDLGFFGKAESQQPFALLQLLITLQKKY